MVMLIEAEALAAGGDADRAARLAERVVSTIGVDEAWKLRGGVATCIVWLRAIVLPFARPPAR